MGVLYCEKFVVGSLTYLPVLGSPGPGRNLEREQRGEGPKTNALERTPCQREVIVGN
jgi:hypothetical protein